MGRDPLQAAVMNGHADTVLTLLNAGASVDHEDAVYMHLQMCMCMYVKTLFYINV